MLRRRDLFHILPAGAAACLGCTSAALCAAQTAVRDSSRSLPAGFGEKADLTWQQVFDFSYKGYARVMKKLAAQIGPEKVLEALGQASSEAAAERVAALLPAAAPRDLGMFEQWMKTTPIYRSALVYDVVEQSASAFEIHVSQCLWAKTWRAQEAADLGYAAICHADYAASAAFHPKLRLTRTKTLMQGHDCCNHRWVMEA